MIGALKQLEDLPAQGWARWLAACDPVDEQCATEYFPVSGTDRLKLDAGPDHPGRPRWSLSNMDDLSVQSSVSAAAVALLPGGARGV
jgi:hypothetical protein